MNDLASFLNARLDEDEEVARGVHDRSEPWPGQWEPDGINVVRTYNGWVLVRGADLAPGLVAHITRHDPARALREVAAKRAIVRRCAINMNEPDVYPNGLVSPRAALARLTLVDMAAVYSGHPDYREEWKP